MRLRRRFRKGGGGGRFSAMLSARSVLVALVILVAAGCSAKLTSDLSINGEKQEIASCRSGAVYGFRGVELTAKSGTKVRVASTITGEAGVVVMQKGSLVGSDLGTCGTFQISDQSSTINDVKNVKGKAVLDCAADGLAVKGTVSFENCH
jgi:hypothetical protein